MLNVNISTRIRTQYFYSCFVNIWKVVHIQLWKFGTAQLGLLSNNFCFWNITCQYFPLSGRSTNENLFIKLDSIPRPIVALPLAQAHSHVAHVAHPNRRANFLRAIKDLDKYFNMQIMKSREYKQAITKNSGPVYQFCFHSRNWREELT